jgi:hypothetical protein
MPEGYADAATRGAETPAERPLERGVKALGRCKMSSQDAVHEEAW